MNKIYGAVGMMKKAGALLSGFDRVAEAVKEDKVHLIMTAGDISPKSLKEIQHVARRYNIEVIGIPVTMDEICRLIGKRAGILGAVNQGLADIVRKEVNNMSCANEEE